MKDITSKLHQYIRPFLQNSVFTYSNNLSFCSLSTFWHYILVAALNTVTACISSRVIFRRGTFCFTAATYVWCVPNAISSLAYKMKESIIKNCYCAHLICKNVKGGRVLHIYFVSFHCSLMDRSQNTLSSITFKYTSLPCSYQEGHLKHHF